MRSGQLLEPPDSHRLNAAEAWLTLRNWREAKAELDHITEANREHPAVLDAYADVCEVSQNWQEGARFMEALITREPDNVDHWLRLHAALLFARRYPEACDCLEKALHRFPHHPALLFKLAVTSAQLGKYENAGFVLYELFTTDGGKYRRTYLGMALDWKEFEPMRDRLLAWQKEFADAPGETSEDAPPTNRTVL
ncbi:MAG: tetratricopeptide repeat protein [Verrucomicrobiota bacterium]